MTVSHPSTHADMLTIEEAPEEGPTKFHFYVWIGVMERNNPHTLWLRPLGLKHSEEHGRVGPLQHEVWLSIMDELFDDSSTLILCTDSAGAYFQAHAGIIEHFAVNHSEHEWSRPEKCWPTRRRW